MESRSNDVDVDNVADGGVGVQYLVSRRQLKTEQSKGESAYLLLYPPAKHGTEESVYQQFPGPLWAQYEPVLKAEVSTGFVQYLSRATQELQFDSYEDIAKYYFDPL
jgi:hypothetical protein